MEPIRSRESIVGIYFIVGDMKIPAKHLAEESPTMSIFWVEAGIGTCIQKLVDSMDEVLLV